MWYHFPNLIQHPNFSHIPLTHTPLHIDTCFASCKVTVTTYTALQMESHLANGKTIINFTTFTSQKIVRRLPWSQDHLHLPEDRCGHKSTYCMFEGLTKSSSMFLFSWTLLWLWTAEYLVEMDTLLHRFFTLQFRLVHFLSSWGDWFKRQLKQ